MRGIFTYLLLLACFISSAQSFQGTTLTIIVTNLDEWSVGLAVDQQNTGAAVHALPDVHKRLTPRRLNNELVAKQSLVPYFHRRSNVVSRSQEDCEEE